MTRVSKSGLSTFLDFLWLHSSQYLESLFISLGYYFTEVDAYIEELGGMNFFWVRDGELYTPALDGQILHGITRKTIIEIAQMMDIKVHETTMTLEELKLGKADGSITETFIIALNFLSFLKIKIIK